MHLCTETITIFNHRLNPATGDVDLYPTTIPGVSWFDEAIATVDSGSGLIAASKTIIRIPADAATSYTTPQAYQDKPDGLFTLQAGDYIVKGAETDLGLTLSNLKKRHGRVVTILAVTDNRRAPRGPHIKVVGS